MNRMRTKWALLLLSMFLLIELTVSTAEAQKIGRLEILPKNVVVGAGQSIRFTAFAFTVENHAYTPSRMEWHATGGNISKDGTFLAGSESGFYAVTVIAGKDEATARVQIKAVSPPAPQFTRIVITPPTARLRIGQAISFRATAYDRYNRPIPFQPVWQTTGGGSISNTGRFKATSKGSFAITVKAKYGDTLGQATVFIGKSE